MDKTTLLIAAMVVTTPLVVYFLLRDVADIILAAVRRLRERKQDA